MNKQEAIEMIENSEMLTIKDTRNDSTVDMVIKSDVLAIISQIDEPEKVVIPQFVAEWLEECKGVNSLRESMSKNIVPPHVNKWLTEYNMELKTLSCQKCGRKYLENTDDYACIFQVGYCSDCFFSRIKGEW